MKLAFNIASVFLLLLTCRSAGVLFAQNLPPLSSNLSGNEFARYMSNVPLPQKLDFCGEAVPLEIPEVRERFERELILNLQTPGQVILYLKRAGRYFPLFEKILKEENAPDDLKYVSVAESALFMARSPKDAVGMWQFIESTGKAMGLQIDNQIDERRHVEKSTHAAARYLRAGYEDSKSWTIAAAGYNMGHENLRENIKFQHKTNYFDLFLNEETSRYIFRVLAIKYIMQNAKELGFELSPSEVYSAESSKVVEESEAIDDLTQWAEKHRTTYKDVKLLNPWILKRGLPAPRRGVWEILVPSGS